MDPITILLFLIILLALFGGPRRWPASGDAVGFVVTVIVLIIILRLLHVI